MATGDVDWGSVTWTTTTADTNVTFNPIPQQGTTGYVTTGDWTIGGVELGLCYVCSAQDDDIKIFCDECKGLLSFLKEIKSNYELKNMFDIIKSIEEM